MINNQNKIYNEKRDEGDFNEDSGIKKYYLRIILEGIERERATTVPPQRMDGDLYCDDQLRSGINARDVYSYEVTQISVSDGCNRPAVLLNIPHWLSTYVYLTSTSRNNPQDVFFKSGDVNRNNIVDDVDLLKLLLNFNRNWSYSTSSSERPDLNLDGIVNEKDQELILNNFGATGSTVQ